MTYDAQETSTADGQPAVLYEFADGVTTTRYAASASDVTISGTTWTAETIRHSAIRSSKNFGKEDVTFTLPANNSYAQGLVGRTEAQVGVTIKRTHLTDGAEEIFTIWKGYVAQAKRKASVIEITARSYAARTDRLARVPQAQRNCNWTLYGSGCGLSLAAFQSTFTATAVSGRTYTISGLSGVSPAIDDTYYQGGVIEYDGEKRAIASSDVSADTITLLEPFDALDDAIAGSPAPSVDLAPGCPLTRFICDTRFNNLPNYLATPEIPAKNPFEGMAGGKRVDL